MPQASADNSTGAASNDGDYDVKTFIDANEAERIVPLGTETETVLIVASTGNSGIVYVGLDDQVDDTTGIELEAGSALSLDIDANQLGLFGYADTGGDSVRYIFTS